MGGRWQPGQWPWRARLSLRVAVALRRCSRITSSSLLSGAWWSQYACAEPQLSTLHSSQSVGRRPVGQSTATSESRPTTTQHGSRQQHPAGLWSPPPQGAGRRGVSASPREISTHERGEVAGVERDFPRQGQHQRIHEQRPIIETLPAAGIAHAPPKTCRRPCNSRPACTYQRSVPGFLSSASQVSFRSALRPCAGYSAAYEKTMRTNQRQNVQP